MAFFTTDRVSGMCSITSSIVTTSKHLSGTFQVQISANRGCKFGKITEQRKEKHSPSATHIEQRVALSCRHNALQETQHYLHPRQILLHLKVMHLHFGSIFHARIFLLISSPVCFGKGSDVLLFHLYCSDFAVILSSIISTLISKKLLKLMISH